MKKRIIAIVLLALVAFILIWNIGADKRTLINVLEYRGYVKCGDGVYRMREIKYDGNEMIVIERLFDMEKNYGESHITTLFQRVDGKSVKENEVVELSMWSFDDHNFVAMN